MSYKLTECPICGGAAREPLYATRDRHYGIQGEFQLVRCVGCQLVHLDPMYSDEELSNFYPTDYYSYQPRTTKPAKELIRRLVGMRIHTKDPLFPKPGRMLDVGCGTGWILEEMRDNGWEVYGIEISLQAVQVCKDRGLNVHAGTLFDANMPDNFFDYVRLNHSFEHMARPNETLQKIREILKPNGKVLIGIPNEDSFNSRCFGRYWWYRGVPVHPFTYSTNNIQLLLRRNGFSIEKVNFTSDYSGILGSGQICLNRNTSQNSTGALISNPIFQIITQRMAKMLDVLKMGDAIEVIAQKR